MFWGRGDRNPPAPYLPHHHHHHHSMSTISAFIVFTFHALLTRLTPVPVLPDSSCSISSSSSPPLPHTMFVGPWRLYAFPRCLRASRSVPPCCQVAPPSSDPALDVSDILLFDEINPTFQQSRRRLPQSEVHVEKKLQNQLRFGLFYKLNECACTLTVSPSLLCSYSRPHSTCYGIPSLTYLLAVFCNDQYLPWKNG